MATANYTDYSCPTGHYCPLGTQWWNQYPCDAGTYNNLTERTKPGDCLSCPGQWSSVFLVLLCVHMSYSCPLHSSSPPSCCPCCGQWPSVLVTLLATLLIITALLLSLLWSVAQCLCNTSAHFAHHHGPLVTGLHSLVSPTLLRFAVNDYSFIFCLYVQS